MSVRKGVQILTAMLALSLAAGAAACQGGDEVELRVGSYRVTAEIADTEDERRRGLMFRETLPANHGMLFVFPDEAPRSFWMRNTEIPLTIAYADADGRIVSIHDMEPFSEEPVPSRGAAKYALEVNQGELAAKGVQVGDVLEIPDSVKAK
ncbi:MAG: DUF192 domain-containing protein [Spirochaetaceae bacterium]